jgi:hypothetical protein
MAESLSHPSYAPDLKDDIKNVPQINRMRWGGLNSIGPD